MRQKITTGPIPFRKAYIKSVVDRIEVDDQAIRINAINGAPRSMKMALLLRRAAMQEPGNPDKHRLTRQDFDRGFYSGFCRHVMSFFVSSQPIDNGLCRNVIVLGAVRAIRRHSFCHEFDIR